MTMETMMYLKGMSDHDLDNETDTDNKDDIDNKDDKKTTQTELRS